LQVLLYIGVTLLSVGLGMLIYQNIGHGVVVASMAGLTAAYLGYAAWHWPTFTQGVAPSPGLPAVVFSTFTLRCYLRTLRYGLQP